MAPDATDSLQRLLSYLQANHDSLTIDADIHASDVAALTGGLLERFKTSVNYFHGRPLSSEDLVREMDLSMIDMALAWQSEPVHPLLCRPLSDALDSCGLD
jgi:hypothetical protein